MGVFFHQHQVHDPNLLLCGKLGTFQSLAGANYILSGIHLLQFLLFQFGLGAIQIPVQPLHDLTQVHLIIIFLTK